jgi:hypothetical protein
MKQLWRLFWADVSRGQPEATVIALYGTFAAVALIVGGVALVAIVALRR